MNCADARTKLAAYHDGELAPADRARVDGHLRGCGECSAILARLAGIDANVGVPDPGPEYWERFNRRVMDRVENDAAAPAKVLRPNRGWARRRLPYFLPAVAAAALLLVVARQTGMDPFSRISAPPAPREAARSAPEAGAVAVRRAAPPAGASPSIPEASLRKEKKAAPPAILKDERKGDDASAAGGAVSLAEERIAGASGEEKERSARGVETAPAPSPCEAARSLAGRGRLEEAESAQRACLARETTPAAQESGLVFLAELLDRQSRIAEADAVLRETRGQYPDSRPLDDYLRRRSRVQGRPIPDSR